MTYVPPVPGTQIVPPGAIFAIAGSFVDSIPDDLLICDGTNGTPDLRDRFILCAGPDHPEGETGDGEKVVVIP